ncbi:amino acid permease [Rhizosaccharibacter radicis]|uniref:Amino acid permease n=1 Tax=Rhizosaccharibacter radicis TaxID=2782605 RepID=A0ABT1VUW1_9PROT|nr:amino acid permease [Acetobacteraceae bacterium KSS12]
MSRRRSTLTFDRRAADRPGRRPPAHQGTGNEPSAGPAPDTMLPGIPTEALAGAPVRKRTTAGKPGPAAVPASGIRRPAPAAGPLAHLGVTSDGEDGIGVPRRPDTPPALAHTLRTRHVAMISIGGVIGAGLFVGSSAAIAGAGPGVLLSYILAGVLALLVMRMLGEMAIAEPGAGSFVGHIRRGLGDRAAFVAGWIYWLFWAVVVGAEAIGGAALLALYVPIPRVALDLVLVGLLTGTNLVSVRAYGEFEFWFSLLKIVAIVGFVGLGLAALLGAFGPQFATVRPLWADGGFLPKGLGAVLAIIPTIVFQYTGSEIATVAAAESDDPGRNVARATSTVALRVLLFYISSIAVILCLMPWSAQVPGHSPFVAVMDRLGIPGAGLIMSAIVLVAILSCLNSALYVTSRVLFEMAAHGDAPRWLVRTGPGGVPRRAILAGSGIGVAVAIASTLSPDKVFAFLLNASGALILFDYLLIALAQIRLRTRMERAGRRPTFRMWLFPGLSWATIAVVAGVLVAMAVQPGTRVQIELGSLCVLIFFCIKAILSIKAK